MPKKYFKVIELMREIVKRIKLKESFRRTIG